MESPITNMNPFSDSGQILQDEKSSKIQKVKIEDLDIVEQYIDVNNVYEKEAFIEKFEGNANLNSSSEEIFFHIKENTEDRKSCDNRLKKVINNQIVDLNCCVVLEKLSMVQMEMKNEEEIDNINSTNASIESFQDIKIENNTSPEGTSVERTTASSQQKKIKGNYCLYCKTMVKSFARHVLRNHNSEAEIQTICTYPVHSSGRKQLFNKLRKRGNFMYSKITREPLKKYCRGKVLPCDNCLGFYSANLLYRHRNKCTGKNDGLHMVSAQNLMVAESKIDPLLMKTVFTSMRPDEISMIAKQDTLICAFGAEYIKIHRSKNFINIASRKMRELARLLIEMKNRDPTIKSLMDALKTKNFDLLVDAIKSAGKYNTETDTYKSPTYVYSLGTTLKQCIVLALKGKHSSEKEISAEVRRDLMQLIEMICVQWKRKVLSQVTEDLNVTNFDNVSLISLASDLRLLKDCLTSQARISIDAINEQTCNKDHYQNLMETAFCQVLMLNRRRPEGLLMLSLQEYESCSQTKQNEEFVEMVSPSEKILWSKFKRVLVENERGQRVPILFSNEVKEHIKLLTELRKDFVQRNNKYLFANLDSPQSLYSFKVLSKYARMCGASNPESLISTKFRDHLATLTQVFSVPDDDLEQLLTFMGHDANISRGAFRLSYDVYQRSKIAKLLLSMEDTPPAVFDDKTCEVVFNTEENISTKMPEVVDVKPVRPETPKKTSSPRTVDQMKKPRVLITWTQEQKGIVLKYFADHINKKRPPKRWECMALKQCYPVLENKNWEKIKVFVQNVYTRKIKNL